MIKKQKFSAIAGLCVWSLAAIMHAAEVPKVLGDYLKLDAGIKGEIFAVTPPEEINLYVGKVKEAADKDPEWFSEYSVAAKSGVPLPFHEKLGLTKEEYKKYRELWDQRKFEAIQPVGIRLEKVGEDYMVRVTGRAAKISLLRFKVKEGIFKSPNGVMKRIEDIDAAPDSILRAWTGHEWKYEEKTSLGTTKENFAIGKAVDGKYGLIVYRLQDVSSTGRTLYDNSVVIRFALPTKGK